MRRKPKYEQFQHYARARSELYIMLEKLFGKHYNIKIKYIDALWSELKGLLFFRRSVIKDAKFNPCYRPKNIPWYIWPAFVICAPFIAAKECTKKSLIFVLRRILSRKALTALRNFYYNCPLSSVLCPLLLFYLMTKSI